MKVLNGVVNSWSSQLKVILGGAEGNVKICDNQNVNYKWLRAEVRYQKNRQAIVCTLEIKKLKATLRGVNVLLMESRVKCLVYWTKRMSFILMHDIYNRHNASKRIPTLRTVPLHQSLNIFMLTMMMIPKELWPNSCLTQQSVWSTSSNASVSKDRKFYFCSGGPWW